ncbi:hypothetical protein Bbelb_320810 [Branchiostoma belcheri]|nr:hypothetical protein Bbelb_320810 [Branchiostoma belcheri]
MRRKVICCSEVFVVGAAATCFTFVPDKGRQMSPRQDFFSVVGPSFNRLPFNLCGINHMHPVRLADREGRGNKTSCVSEKRPVPYVSQKRRTNDERRRQSRVDPTGAHTNTQTHSLSGNGSRETVGSEEKKKERRHRCRTPAQSFGSLTRKTNLESDKQEWHAFSSSTITSSEVPGIFVWSRRAGDTERREGIDTHATLPVQQHLINI